MATQIQAPATGALIGDDANRNRRFAAMGLLSLFILVMAAYAQGFAASWLTEWYAYDRRVLDALGVGPRERIAGFIHIGRPQRPVEDRPRPPLEQIVTRFPAS